MPTSNPRQRSKTIGALRIVRHLHKVGAGWTVYVAGERRAWFLNSNDLLAWLRGAGWPKAAAAVEEILGQLDA